MRSLSQYKMGTPLVDFEGKESVLLKLMKQRGAIGPNSGGSHSQGPVMSPKVLPGWLGKRFHIVSRVCMALDPDLSNPDPAVCLYHDPGPTPPHPDLMCSSEK